MNKEMITDKFSTLLSDYDLKKHNTDSPLIRANETYNKLINKGIIKKKGNTLRSIEDTHLLRFTVNK